MNRIKDPATWLAFIHGAISIVVTAGMIETSRGMRLASAVTGLLNLAGMLFFDRIIGRPSSPRLVETAGELALVQPLTPPAPLANMARAIFSATARASAAG